MRSMENKPKLGVRARYAMSLRTLTQNIRLQDIPMRIVTRNRRLKSTFLSLSHTTNLQDQTSTLTNMPVPRRKPPCYQKDPHISGGEMEALKEKAELAELNAKKQRKIALKALRARRLAEKQTVMINQDKERVESALRDSVEAHERLSRKFQHAVSTKLKVESQLRKARKIENVVDQGEVQQQPQQQQPSPPQQQPQQPKPQRQQQQQQSQQQQRRRRRRQRYVERLRSQEQECAMEAQETTCTSVPNPEPNTCGYDDSRGKLSSTDSIAQVELVESEAILRSLRDRLRRQGQAQRMQLVEWESQLQLKEERICRVAEKLRKQRLNLRFLKHHAERQREKAMSKSIGKAIISSQIPSALSERKYVRTPAVDCESNLALNISIMHSNKDSKKESQELRPASQICDRRAKFVGTHGKDEGNANSLASLDVSTSVTNLAREASLFYWKDKQRCQHLASGSASSRALDKNEDEVEPIIGTNGLRLFETESGGDTAEERIDMKELGRKRLSVSSDEAVEARHLISNKNAEYDRDEFRSQLYSTPTLPGIRSKESVLLSSVPKPVLPQLPSSVRDRLFTKQVSATIEKVRSAKSRVAEACTQAGIDVTIQKHSQKPLEAQHEQPDMKSRKGKHFGSIKTRRTSTISQHNRLQWLSAFDGRFAKSLSTLEQLKS